MQLEELQNDLNLRLKRQYVSSSVLLSGFRLIDEESRNASAFTDPLNYPFYYYLGDDLQPKSIVEIGFNLGLVSGSLLKGCTEQPDNFLGFQKYGELYYSAKLGTRNIRDVYKNKFEVYIGEFSSLEFQTKLSKTGWDLALVNEASYDNCREILDKLWSCINLDGHLVVDHVSDDAVNQALVDFSKIVNRKFITVNTRYGSGIIRK